MKPRFQMNNLYPDGIGIRPLGMEVDRTGYA